MKKWCWFLMMAMVSGGISRGVCYADDVALAQEYKTVRSQLQSMGHGYYSGQEWSDLFARLDALSASADRAKRYDLVVEATLLKAQALTDMQGRHREAMDLLETLKGRFADDGPKNMKKVYIVQAECYAKQGDIASISRLIDAFTKSAYYDGEKYAYSGGRGPDDPLVVVRPTAPGNNSITVTAMKKAMGTARLAPGRPAPPFQARDANGAPV
ncbi:MAG: hypothetical protein EOM20_19755, partial [Spartobacteria bacterium]|nr:hypothetical protein [Spartobacteria bacterium]